MIIEYLCNVGYRGGREIDAYLVSMYESIEVLMKKRVYLFGAGENGFLAKEILERKGMNIYGFVDNNSRIAGKKIGEHEILQVNDPRIEDDAYYVICVNEKNIAGVRLQLMAMQIGNYSIFIKLNGHSFANENMELHDAILDGINMICFKNEDYRTAIPYCGYSLGGDGSKIGNVNWLIKSTEWSHPGYNWLYDFLLTHSNAGILEIGPGFGLMSYVFLKKFPQTQMSWLVFGNMNKQELDSENPYENGLVKVKEIFKERVNYNFGRIERDSGLIKDKYDLIIMTEVFEHFALNPVQTMKKIKDALLPGGRLLLTTPNWGHLPTFETWKDLSKSEETDETRYEELLQCGHVYQYSYNEMLEVIKEAGYDIEYYELSESNNHNFFLK